MSEYEEGDNVMTISCLHRFHEDCINEWLKDNNTCPVCKLEVLESQD